jgi:hypothetical protein
MILPLLSVALTFFMLGAGASSDQRIIAWD